MVHYHIRPGSFTLASSVEEFEMPPDLMGILHDKSTWIRQGLMIGNTVLEPGWKGFLTLELFYRGEGALVIPAGAGIGQVIFHQVKNPSWYEGKYQGQADEPVPAIASV
jgi:dCTP deaminase